MPMGKIHTVRETGLMGLTDREVEASRTLHGDNALPRGKKRGFLRQLLSNFSDPIIRVLLIALAVQVTVMFRDIDWLETGGILLAVFLSTFVSTLSEWGSERAFEKLRAGTTAGMCRVRREGQVYSIPAEELVVGDILLLSGGEMVQADALILEGEVSVDESALNGESAEVVKHRTHAEDPRGILLRGSVVCEGQAQCRVIRVGGNTHYGTLARELQSPTRESPLKLRLSRLAGQISRIGYVMAAVVALAYLFSELVISQGFDIQNIRACFLDTPYLISTLLHTVTLVITVVVVAVPEGLPMMITVVLSSNMRRMLKGGVLVRKMVGIETAGSLNILFTDKTGTLTSGHMSVCGVLGGNGVFYSGLSALKNTPSMLEELAISAHYNTDSTLSEGRAVGGNATDRAILSFFAPCQVLRLEVEEKLPFHSKRKLAMARLGKTVYLKGAPDVLLPQVTQCLSPLGASEPFGMERRAELDKHLLTHAQRGERLLCVCTAKEWTGVGIPPLCLVGVMVLRDRVREEARDALRRLARAGVQVVMVTGDGRETALAIAQESGLVVGDNYGVYSGREIASMEEEELKEILPTLRVVYRAMPQDKSRLVRAAQSLNLVTGMTGDGINDAPSLKLSDVGFAMGSGTDIAKEAGDIVILDDNIASIARTVLYGRTIFKSIRKFITFQLTMNLCAVGVSLLGQFVGIGTPITIIQMLWINIIMDTLGGLAFAGEAPVEGYMQEKPKSREEPILSPSMVRRIGVTGLYTLGLCIWYLTSPITAYLFGRGRDSVYFLTVLFALFVFCGIANCICARSDGLRMLAGIWKNRFFLPIMVFICLVQVTMIYFGGAVFRTAPLAAGDLWFAIGLAMTVLPVDYLRRLFARLSGH